MIIVLLKRIYLLESWLGCILVFMEKYYDEKLVLSSFSKQSISDSRSRLIKTFGNIQRYKVD